MSTILVNRQTETGRILEKGEQVTLGPNEYKHYIPDGSCCDNCRHANIGDHNDRKQTCVDSGLTGNDLCVGWACRTCPPDGVQGNFPGGFKAPIVRRGDEETPTAHTECEPAYHDVGAVPHPEEEEDYKRDREQREADEAAEDTAEHNDKDDTFEAFFDKQQHEAEFAPPEVGTCFLCEGTFDLSTMTSVDGESVCTECAQCL